MPPRFAYWTIIAGGLPTAFRMAEREDLLPTFRRIQVKHPDAEMKYFARGRLWTSPEEARLAAEARRAPKARDNAQSARGATRGRDWRPGGDHRDPRQKFDDAKKARNLERRRQRFERRTRSAKSPNANREIVSEDAVRPRAKRPFTPKQLDRREDARGGPGREKRFRRKESGTDARPGKRNRRRS
jgi:hypothetical protein